MQYLPLACGNVILYLQCKVNIQLIFLTWIVISLQCVGIYGVPFLGHILDMTSWNGRIFSVDNRTDLQRNITFHHYYIVLWPLQNDNYCIWNWLSLVSDYNLLHEAIVLYLEHAESEKVQNQHLVFWKVDTKTPTLRRKLTSYNIIFQTRHNVQYGDKK